LKGKASTMPHNWRPTLDRLDDPDTGRVVGEHPLSLVVDREDAIFAEVARRKERVLGCPGRRPQGGVKITGSAGCPSASSSA